MDICENVNYIIILKVKTNLGVLNFDTTISRVFYGKAY